jgi:dihydroflavonol-4-reductase
MKTIYLVTGAGGHLAAALMRLLTPLDGEVRGLLLPSEAAPDMKNVDFYRGDVTKKETLTSFFTVPDGCEAVVFHLAGLISIESAIPPRLYDVNVNGVKNVLAMCREHSVRRLVYVSSVHAIPELPGRATMREVDAYSPELVKGAYAKTKAEASEAVLEAAKQGLDAVIVQPSGILGPYDLGRNYLVQMIADYLSGKLPAGVDGGYDFVDVRDVAMGCLLAAEKGVSGESYILSNRYCTIRDLFGYICLAARRRRKPCVPIWLARAAAPLIESAGRTLHKRPLYTRYSLHTLTNGGLFSHDKATRELGFSPRDLKTTVADTVRWLLDSRKKPGMAK